MISFVRWELWLPIMTEKSGAKCEFSTLSFEQKLKFLALNEADYDYWSGLHNVWAKEIINRYKIWVDRFMKETTDKFKSRMKSNKNILGLVPLEKILKDEYWLTDTEYEKVAEYLKLIQDHPEYYVWASWKNLLSISWVGIGVLIWIWISLVLAGIGYYAYKKINNPFWLQETEQVASWGSVEMVNFEECFEIMAAKATYAIKDENGEDATTTYEEDAIKFNEGWPRRLKVTKKWIENTINFFEWRSIDLKARIDVWYKFDAKSAKCTVEKKPNWKWIFHVKIKRPELQIMDVKAEVVRSSREKIINLSKFDDFEMRALEDVKEKTLKKADNPENLAASKESLRKSMLSVFKTTWFANSQMTIYGEDVEDVIIEYEN